MKLITLLIITLLVSATLVDCNKIMRRKSKSTGNFIEENAAALHVLAFATAFVTAPVWVPIYLVRDNIKNRKKKKQQRW